MTSLKSYKKMHSLIDILKKLINFKTVSPKGYDATLYVASFLESLGFQCDIQKFGKDDKETTNLYATYGNGSPNICFAGHVDVVPAMNESLWRFDPFDATEHEGAIYGRGAVDMKGALACMFVAVEEFLQKYQDNFKGSISFLITSDEERDAEFGTCKMLEYIKDKYPKIDLCILGECTSKKQIGDTVKIGRRGSINFNLRLFGKQGHVAYPNDALNPIPILTNIANKLIHITLDEGSEFFTPSNLEITSIDVGNDVTNIIPESANMKFNIRFNDHHNTEKLVDLVKQNIQDCMSKSKCSYKLNYKSSSNSFIQKISPQMQYFIDTIQKVTATYPSIKTDGGTSDARFIHHYCNVIEFGLKSDLAHQIDESVQISDLQILHKVYYFFLKSLVERSNGK